MPVLLIIPTGIGCSVGGYAGDAIPFARLLAAASGCLITHPNVMNGASLYWNDTRIQYVEGFGIDLFTAGEIYLRPVRQQRIGLLFDKALEPELIARQLHVVNACHASMGLDVGPIVTTDKALGISCTKGSSGSSWGGIAFPDSLLRAGEKLKEEGASAVAVVTRFPDQSDDNAFEAYRKGKGVDTMAGAEAVISHLLVRHLSIPCAHAPALSTVPMIKDLDPRAAAEEIGYTFLSSVLVGLSRAPDLVQVDRGGVYENTSTSNSLRIEELGAAVVPEGALGGASVLACIERKIPVIVVANQSVLNIDQEAIGIKDTLNFGNQRLILRASSYQEAAGLLLGLREGIAISSLQRPIKQVT